MRVDPIAFLSRVLLGAMVLLCCALLSAQAQTQTPLPAYPEPNAMIASGLQAAALIDAGRGGELWDGGSAVAKRAGGKQAFLDGVAKSRGGVGAPVHREWLSVERGEVAPGTTGTATPGFYYSLRYTVRLRDRVFNELISFRRDEDGMWRWVGYVVQ